MVVIRGLAMTAGSSPQPAGRDGQQAAQQLGGDHRDNEGQTDHQGDGGSHLAEEGQPGQIDQGQGHAAQHPHLELLPGGSPPVAQPELPQREASDDGDRGLAAGSCLRCP